MKIALAAETARLKLENDLRQMTNERDEVVKQA